MQSEITESNRLKRVFLCLIANERDFVSHKHSVINKCFGNLIRDFCVVSPHFLKTLTRASARGSPRCILAYI